MLYGWLHCTLGDVLLTLGSFWMVSLFSHSRRWFLNISRLNFISFIMIGVAGTIISERVNVYILKSWTYTPSMPIVPWLDVGLTPFLQWIVIPPVVVLSLRHHFLSGQK